MRIAMLVETSRKETTTHLRGDGVAEGVLVMHSFVCPCPVFCLLGNVHLQPNMTCDVDCRLKMRLGRKTLLTCCETIVIKLIIIFIIKITFVIKMFLFLFSSFFSSRLLLIVDIHALCQVKIPNQRKRVLVLSTARRLCCVARCFSSMELCSNQS